MIDNRILLEIIENIFKLLVYLCTMLTFIINIPFLYSNFSLTKLKKISFCCVILRVVSIVIQIFAITFRVELNMDISQSFFALVLNCMLLYFEYKKYIFFNGL